MKVLVIGSGGREHALCWKLKQSPLVSELYCAPGNPGIAEHAKCIPIQVDDIAALLKYAQENKVDFTVVGPELALSLGVVDSFEAAGLVIFGPSKAAAQLESSKGFTKDLLSSIRVPTAAYKRCNSLEQAAAFVESASLPLVLKADGLAAGKGVFICRNRAEVQHGLSVIYSDLKNSEVVIEEFLEGVEASLIVATNGDQIVAMATSHDYKRLQDNDQGPNTGGMGSISPTHRLSLQQEQYCIENIIRPVLVEMRRRGAPFKGFLYAGLMIGASGQINVLEFNTRMGDPECQSILRRLDSDLCQLLFSLSKPNSKLEALNWSKKVSGTVVLASAGYPITSSKGDEINGLNLVSAIEGIEIFHAGTKLSEQGRIVTNGGRVLNVTAVADDMQQLRTKLYRAVDMIQFRAMQLRRDIGLN